MYARLMAGLYIDSDLSRVPVRLRNKAAEADIEVALDVVVRGWWFLNRTKRTEKKTEK